MLRHLRRLTGRGHRSYPVGPHAGQERHAPTFVPLIVTALCLGLGGIARGEDPILEWNAIMIQADAVDHGETVREQPGPILASRAFAMTSSAMYDALNSIEAIGTPYLTVAPDAESASIVAAVAQAAHDTLVELYPAQSVAFDAALIESLARVPAGAALGLSAEEVDTALRRLKLAGVRRPAREAHPSLLVLPYSGGRHPRIGFLDGALRPQRETKISVFPPWHDGGYVVVDVPEAIWCQESGQRELLYLAHTHVPPRWDKQGIALEPLEWKRRPGGMLEVERRLPNRVTFGTKVVPERQGVRLELWLTNGTNRKLTDLGVQVCVLLKAANGFEQRSDDNKVFAKPFAACRNSTCKRWVIAAWEPCVRVWANAACPCLHSDPQIPDCAPGETQRVRGWLSFYEGDDIQGEFGRLQAIIFGSKKAE